MGKITVTENELFEALQTYFGAYIAGIVSAGIYKELGGERDGQPE